MRIKKGNNDRCPTIVFFALIILLSITTPASALTLLEDYEDPPVQGITPPSTAYTCDGDTYYGIFDNSTDLRVLYGEGAAAGIAIVDDGAENQFVQTKSNSVSVGTLLGILDHPSFTNQFDNGGPFTLVGDYATLANKPVLISDTSIISVYVRSNYNVGIRFVFMDIDYEDWVTAIQPVESSWSTISANDLSPRHPVAVGI
ncbi:MAG: hypothetical protein KKI12_12080 [Proteobacteria bacterium]|nr:hypothetical protein [Pseudomonadota bacterium]MBU4288894.1 hypothetical protein [Pseudomonadota bacterium]MCG2759109.1 hypothetical protein [Desulfobacteraceae bacterium]